MISRMGVRRREGIGTCTVSIGASETQVIYNPGLLACIAPTAGHRQPLFLGHCQAKSMTIESCR
jgi:hypothetical protein